MDERARVQALREQGMTYKEIGAKLGRDEKAAWRLLHPEAVAADNARRTAAKRQWERENDRGACDKCGEPMSVGARRHGWTYCARCRKAERRAERLAKAREMERLWKSGLTLREIAERLGTTRGTIGVEFARLRREGLADLPYRERQWT